MDRYDPRLNASAPVLAAGSDRSGQITAANTPQDLAPANPARRGLSGQNISNGDLWISETGEAAVGASGSYKVEPGRFFSVATNRAIRIIGAAQGQKFTATEY